MHTPEQAPSTIAAAIGGFLTAVATGFVAIFKYRAQRGKEHKNEEIGLATLHSQGVQDLLDRYEEQVKDNATEILSLKAEVEKLRALMLEMAARHQLAMAEAEARHRVEMAAMEARYQLQQEKMEARYKVSMPREIDSPDAPKT